MIEVRTPCRLHFGLLAFNPQGTRQFGGLGLMVHRPDIAIGVEPAQGFSATGALADRAAAFAQRFAANCGQPVDGAHIDVRRAPRPHTGLGTGTQLGLAVAKAMAMLIDREDMPVADMAALVDRGQRSAIGAYGFGQGGLIIEGGKCEPARLSTLLMRYPFCDDWRIVLICPQRLQGVWGQSERDAFDHMPPISDQATAEMCRLVLLGLLPALIERDLEHFGQALYDLQQTVGSCFRLAQGGIYADPWLEQVVKFIRDQGITGVGQSSWGPTLYAVTADEHQAHDLAARVGRHFHLHADEVLITQADNHGATVGCQGVATR